MKGGRPGLKCPSCRSNLRKEHRNGVHPDRERWECTGCHRMFSRGDNVGLG
jgi:transposase-like protein